MADFEMANYKIPQNFYFLEHSISMLHDEMLSSLDAFGQQVQVLNSTTSKLMQIEQQIIDLWTEALHVLQHNATVQTLSDDLDSGLQQLELIVANIEHEQHGCSNVNELTDERCKMYANVLRLSTKLGERFALFRDEYGAYAKDFEKVRKVYNIVLEYVISTFSVLVRSSHERAQCSHSYVDFSRTQSHTDGWRYQAKRRFVF